MGFKCFSIRQNDPGSQTLVTVGSSSSRSHCVVLNPIPASVTVCPDLFQQEQNPFFTAGLSLVLLAEDDVVEGGACPGLGLPAAACHRCTRYGLFKATAAARTIMQDLDQQGDTARLPHGDTTVWSARQRQQRPRHLILISVGKNGQQPEHHLHLQVTPKSRSPVCHLSQCFNPHVIANISFPFVVWQFEKWRLKTYTHVSPYILLRTAICQQQIIKLIPTALKHIESQTKESKTAEQKKSEVINSHWVFGINHIYSQLHTLTLI